MEDKLQTLHSNLVKEGYDLPDFGTFKTDMSDPLKSKKLHDNLVGAGYELPDYDTFLGDMGLVKKKVPPISPMESARKGETVLQELGQPSKESGTPKPPYQSTKVNYEETLPESITPTSVIKSNTVKGKYLGQKQVELSNKITTDFEKESNKLKSDYEKRLSQEGADKKQLEEEYRVRLDDLKLRKEKEASNEWDKMVDSNNYEYLAPEDVKGLGKEIDKVISQNIPYNKKEEALGAIKDNFLSKISILPPDIQNTIKREINEVFAKKTLFDEKGNITSYGWKKEAEQKLNQIQGAKNRVLFDFKQKYPDFTEQITPTPSGGVLQGFSPSADADPAKRQQFYSDYIEYKKNKDLLGKAEEKLGNIMQTNENSASFADAFRLGGRDLLASVSSAGWSDVAKAFENATIATKVQKGEKLSEGEQALFDTMGLFDAYQQGLAGKGFKLGNTLAQSIPMMESIASLNAMGVLGGAGTATLKQIAKKEGIKKLLTKEGAKLIGKEALSFGGAMAKGAPLTPLSWTRQQQGLSGQKVLNDKGEWSVDKSTVENKVEATIKGLATGATELGSEILGGYMGEFGEVLKRIPGLKNIRLPKAVSQIAKTAGMQGAPTEIAEELINMLWQAPIGDQPLSEISWQDIWDTVWTTAGLTTILGSAAIPGGVVSTIQRGRNYDVIKIFGKDAVAQVRDAIAEKDVAKLEASIKNAFEGKTAEDLGMDVETAQRRLFSYAKSIATEVVAKDNSPESKPQDTGETFTVPQVGAEPLVFKTKQEFFDWLDKNGEEKLPSPNEVGYLDTNVYRAMDEWKINNAEKLAREAMAKEEERAKQLKAIEDLKAAEKTEEPVGTITPMGTKDGLDWYNVVNGQGQRDTFSVPEGSSQEVVTAKSKELVKLQDNLIFGNAQNIEKQVPTKDVLGNKILSPKEWNAVNDREEIEQETITRTITDTNGNTFDVDFGIAPFLQRIFKLGLNTGQSDSGMKSDHPNHRYVEGEKKGEIIEGGTYLTFWKPEATVVEQAGRKVNSQEDINSIRDSALKSGFVVEDGTVFYQPSLVMRLPATTDGTSRANILKEANEMLNGEHPEYGVSGDSHPSGNNFMEWLDLRNDVYEPIIVKKHGGELHISDKEIANRFDNFVSLLEKSKQSAKVKPKVETGGIQNASKIGEGIGQSIGETPRMVEGTQGGLQMGDNVQVGVAQGQEEGRGASGENVVTPELIPQEGETATQVSVEGNVPPPPESGQIDVTGSEIQGKKPLGAQERSLNQIETEQQQILSDIINENKGFYNTLHGEQAVKNANKFIEDRGIDAATRELEQPTKDINEYPTRQVARMVLIDHYTRILGGATATKEQKDNAYIATNNLQQRISIEANKTGQGNAHLNLWKVMQPAGLLEFTKRHIAEFNDNKLKRKIGDKSIGQLLDLVYKQLSEANKEIIDDILAGKEIEAKMPVEKPNVKREPAKKKTVPKEQVKAEKDYRKKLLDDYRKSQGKVTLQAGIPLTAEQIELGGNLIASYIREGYYRAVDIINKLIDDLKAIGLNVTEDDLDPILSTKKEGNQTFRSWMREQEASVGLTEEMKSLKLRISDIVKMHWSKRDELGRTLAQKLVDDAGLSETEAKKLETAILDEYNKRIQDRLKSFKDLSILLGREKVPSDKKTKTRLDRLIELVNLGALEENVYRGLFAGKFGLAPEITEEQGRIIMQKASVVQQMTDKGWFYREAVKDLTKYLYELNPTSKFNEWAETWIALSYSNMLFGYFTTILNLWSSGSNILLKPLRDATNMSRWKRALKSKNPSGEVYMPGGEMYYLPMFQGIAHGAVDAAEIYANGDVGSKYIEEITKSKQFKVGQLERDKFGNGKRFKPIKVGGIDLNIFNLNKYSGRNLAAQDRLMFNTIFEMEVASIIRRNLANTQNLTGSALSTAVMDELQGAKVDKALLEQQIEAEAAKFKELTGQETTDRQKKIRMRELMVKQLPITEEERLDAERLAQGNIFTDTRGGIVATLANAIGMLSNSNPSLGVIVKPFIPFTKIVGNVTEYMLDHVPFYGFLRANGKSLSLIKKKMNPDAMTAQMGEKGSNLYYEQMGRAWLGTMSFTVLAMMLLGNDDEDWVQISGGYNQEGFKKGGRENVMPKYTIRIGGVDISYLNIPALAIPLGLIGNINDAIKMKMPSDEISNRLAATMLLKAIANTALMTKDMSFVQGTQNLLTLITDALSMEEGGWKKAGQNMAKSYIGFALRPLPQNSALVQQTWKFFDPVSYSQKDIKSILAYSAGLQHFVNYPTIDQLGDEVRTYPGEALLPYTHWFNIKGNDARWRFLADNNAIPNKIQNTTTYIDTEDGVEKRTLEVKELHDYTKLAGKMFSDKLESYMNDAAKVSKRSGDIISEENYKGETETKTGVQVDVDKMWSDARKSARTALFRWYDFKKTNAKDWDLMLSTDAVKEPEMTAVEIEIGNEKVKLTKEQMVEYNQLAMERYHERIMRYLNSKERVKDDKARVQDNGKTRFENKTDDEWREAKSRAERQMKRQLRNEKTNSAK